LVLHSITQFHLVSGLMLVRSY